MRTASMWDGSAKKLMLLLAAALWIASGAFASAEQILLRNGHVIDPKNNVNATLDVAIVDGKIAAVGSHLPASLGEKVVDVSGLIVTPGLLDIHAHLYASPTRPRELAGHLSVYPDGHTFRYGVTTIVDAGTSGWRTFLDFQEHVIRRAKTRVLAFLNIVGEGMQGPDDAEQDVNDMDPLAASAMAIHHHDAIVGFKTAHFNGPSWTAVDRAVQAGELAQLPVMVDFGIFRKERPYQELVLKRMRPGDISTHMYTSHIPMFDSSGQLQPYLEQAHNRGVFFDVGHGCASFAFRQAAPAVAQGWMPDSLSTDLHTDSMLGGMKDMTNLMSKFLNMGMPLEQLIAACTWQPANEIHRPKLGNLSIGAPADVAVLRLESGDFGFIDTDGQRLHGTKRFEAELTIHDGHVCWDLNGLMAQPWHQEPKLLAKNLAHHITRVTFGKTNLFSTPKKKPSAVKAPKLPAPGPMIHPMVHPALKI